MKALRELTWVETKLQFRDWGTVTFGLLFPAVLLVVLGYAFPGFMDATDDLGGRRPVDVYTPIALVLVLVMVGISAISSVLATYRHEGVLRRLRVTPVGPTRLLAAQLAAQLFVALLGSALALTVAFTVLAVPTPVSWVGTIGALALTAAALFAVGLLIGALAPSTSAAQAISTVVWIPLMALAGLWFPRELMPDLMRRLSDLSPGGAGVDAMQEAWFGGGAPGSSLAVLAGATVIIGALAAWSFRWD